MTEGRQPYRTTDRRRFPPTPSATVATTRSLSANHKHKSNPTTFVAFGDRVQHSSFVSLIALYFPRRNAISPFFDYASLRRRTMATHALDRLVVVLVADFFDCINTIITINNNVNSPQTFSTTIETIIQKSPRSSTRTRTLGHDQDGIAAPGRAICARRYRPHCAVQWLDAPSAGGFATSQLPVYCGANGQ